MPIGAPRDGFLYPILTLMMDSYNLIQPRLRGYKTFFMLNSADQEIYPAHKC